MSLYTRIIDLQKLAAAWDRVKRNKPSPGVDNVTYEMFDLRKREELKSLQVELQTHSYEPLPVKRITLYKEEKARTIALYSMRDKVVQQSLAQELNRTFDSRFVDNTFAYRPDKSALIAMEWIEKEIHKNERSMALKLDIHHFFDTIVWGKLEAELRKVIEEDDVIELIRQNATTRVVDDTGEITDLQKGIHQGSAIAPILSNIYLLEFDNWLSKQDVFFIRYSDDILILGESREQLLSLAREITNRMSFLGLRLNEQKTICCPLSEGIDFLGYRFDMNGRTVPQKAKDNLCDRLEIMWLTAQLPFEQKIQKAAEIINGWEQYFTLEKEIGSILEFVPVAAMSHKKPDYLDTLCKQRLSVSNIYKDIASYLASIWREHGKVDMELFEYEQFFQMPTCEYGCRNLETNPKTPQLMELIDFYRKLMVMETVDTATEVMQLYSDLREYENASIWMKRKEQLELSQRGDDLKIVAEENANYPDLVMNQATSERILKLFGGREDIYSIETIGNGGKRQTETQFIPLTDTVVKDHIKGQTTVGTYVQRPNSTVKAIVVDVDVSKKVLLQYSRSTPEFKEYMRKAYDVARGIQKIYASWGLNGYIEYSGCRGYHVWLLFTEWIPVRYANMFCDLLEQKLEKDDDITVEYFPNKTRVKEGKYGQCIKLPYGRHGRTGELSYFISENGTRIADVNAFLDSLARFQLVAVKKILAVNSDSSENATRVVELDKNEYQNIPPSINVVLENCSLMRYLCNKAQKTGYLSHFERLSLLYVFGHLGDEGKEFIHEVMKKTLNYQSQVTEKFISRIPEKPISCVKLRDQYKSITAEYGCSCNFKRTKNCYPSPVLHAISLSPDIAERITIPTSKSLTKENEQKVIDELNIHKKAEDLAGKILDLKKQRRKMDASILRTENELSKLFDAQGIECLEIEMGMLVRRKKEGGYEWLIEI